MQQRAIAANGVELSVAEAGAGGRPLLLVHGFTGAKEDFTEWLDALAERGWHAVAPDLRGHGDSENPSSESDYSLASFAADLLGLADSLGWPGFTLLGHSMGGMVVQQALLVAPQRVQGLVLMDTGHGPLLIDGVDPDLVAAGIAHVRSHGARGWLEITADPDGDSALTTRADRRVRATRPGYVEFGERKVLACAPQMICAMVPALFGQADRLEQLAQHEVPTLVIVGEQDTPFLAPSERMAHAMPGARLAVIADAGHSPQFENPQGWWDELEEFLDGLADRIADRTRPEKVEQ